MNENENEKLYAVVPLFVMRDARLKLTDLLILMRISMLQAKTGKCFASNKWFASEFGLSVRRVEATMSRLRKWGYIESETTRDGRKTKRHIWCTWSLEIVLDTTEFDELADPSPRDGRSPADPLINDGPPYTTYKDRSKRRGSAEADHGHTSFSSNGFGVVASPNKDTTEYKLLKQVKEANLKRGMSQSYQLTNYQMAHFKKLMRRHGEAKVQQVVKFYCSKDYRGPKVTYPKAFLKDGVWNWITELLEDQPKETKLTAKQQRLADNLRAHNWPKRSERQLDEFVQTTWSSFHRLRTNLEDLTEDKQFDACAEHVLNAMRSTYDATSEYCQHVRLDVERWQKWNGKLMPLAFRLGEDDNSIRYFHDHYCVNLTTSDKLERFTERTFGYASS